MPINGVSGRVRAPRTCKIRLGYKPAGKDYPKDSDVFVGYEKDGVDKRITDAYGGGTKITDAEGNAFNLGKSLRMMLPWEFDDVCEGREVGLELMNRAWSHSKMRCIGTGGDHAGEAVCRDEPMLAEIAKATKQKAVARDDGSSWDVVCLGPKCPYWSSNLAKNKQATCHREMRLWAWLLAPATDPEDKTFLKKLAAVEIASGSWNGMLDVQSGFRTIRSLVNRTALIPFALKRVPRTVLSDGKRVIKATLLVDFDQDEVIRFGYSDPKLALVRPEVRRQLLAQRREMLELAALESGHDSFRDVVPRLEEHRGEGGSDFPTSLEEPKSEPVIADRDQVVEEAAGAASAPSEPTETELNRHLNQGERDELKVLCGGVPGETETLEHFKELVCLAYKHFDEWQPQWENTTPPLSSLKVKHARWIRQALEAEAMVAADSRSD